MADSLPTELIQLLHARDAVSREQGWEQFVLVHSTLLLKVARVRAREYDAAMDAYAYILEQLRKEDCHRLRAYVVDSRSTFATWLVVVARRLCVDFARQRYGRGGRSERTADDRRERRRLSDLVAGEIDLANIPDPSGATPATELDAADIHARVSRAVAELEPSDRLLLVLRFEDGLTAERIATVLALPSPFHVYRRLTRVLEILRAKIDEESDARVRKTPAIVRSS